MQYQKILKMLKNISYLSAGLDVGTDFTWMSIILPNGTLAGEPREFAVSKIREVQKMDSLKSRCFLKSTKIYHISLLYFLRNKGFDCSITNPIIINE